MRTEIKIGIVVGLVVLVGVLIFFVGKGRQRGQTVTDVLPVEAPARLAGDTQQEQAPRAGPTGRVPARPGRTSAAPAERAPRRPTVAAKPPVTPVEPVATRLPAVVTPAAETPAVAAAPTPPAEPTSLELPPLVAGEPSRGPQISSGPAELSRAVTPPLPVVESLPTGGVPAVAPPAKQAEAASGALLPPGGRERPSEPRKHTVAAGETLWSIAERYYGDGNLWPKIKAANLGLDERALKVGQVLLVPPKEETPAGPGKPKPQATAPTAGRYTYVVEEGDTLIRIARNVLKDENRWTEIYELNRDKLSDPDLVPVGTHLKLPEK